MKFNNEEERLSYIIGKLALLETHIINLIYPVQSISSTLKDPNRVKDLLEVMSKPILIDDRYLQENLKIFRKEMAEFMQETQKLDIKQAFNEIKYIGNRLNNIEKVLSEMQEKGLRKNVHLDVTIDGHKVETRTLQRKESLEEENHLNKLLEFLEEREVVILTHRVGLFGEKKKTFTEIGKMLKVSGDRVGQIFRRICRKLRREECLVLVKKIPHPELREIVLG